MKCPRCGAETVTTAMVDNACTQCDYVEDIYPDADPQIDSSRCEDPDLD